MTPQPPLIQMMVRLREYADDPRNWPQRAVAGFFTQKFTMMMKDQHAKALFRQAYCALRALKATGGNAYKATVDAINWLNQHPPENIACRQGCSACCYQRVVVSKTEAGILRKHLTDQDVAHLQAQRGRGIDDYKILEASSRCVFLGPDNKCRVYENRPLVCRNVYAREAEKCATNEAQELPTITASEAITSAFWQMEPVGHLPEMLLQEVSR